MTKKYIVKNCELICNGECPNSKTGFCEDCTDCLIKQIINECEWDTINTNDRGDLAERILSLFIIEECEQ